MDYEKMRKHWDRATSYERTFLAMHPFLVKVIEENARKATDEQSAVLLETAITTPPMHFATAISQHF